MRNGHQKNAKIVISILFLSFIGYALCSAADKFNPPPTKVDIVTDTVSGHVIEDPYRWLEDQNSPATREWIDAQNSYTDSILQSLPQRDRLKKRFSELIKTDYTSRPSQRGNRFFLYKKTGDQEQYIIYMREGLHGEDRVLVDPNTLSDDKTKSVGMLDISDDGVVLAYYIRDGGEDEFKVKLLNIDNGDEFPDSLPRGDYFSLSLTSDMSGYYYSLRDENGSRIFYHAVGTDIKNDSMLFGEGYGPEKIITANITEDGKYLIIYVYDGSSGEKTEVYYKNLVTDSIIQTLVNDVEAIFEVTIVDDDLYINTNWNAPNWKIMAGDMSNPSPDHWHDLIPESDAVIRGFSTVGGKLFVNFLENVISHVKIYETDGNNVGEIAFPAIGTVSGVGGRWDSDIAFYTYYSYYIPTTNYLYHVSTGEREIWSQLEVPVNTDDFKVEQVWYDSKDGTRVPMFIMHLKDIKLDGNNPALLTGYGGFRSTQQPYFSAMAVNFVENGGVFAAPALRGGGEFGEKWHAEGMLAKKQNTFDDFYAAAEWLIKNKYTDSARLAIEGGSNGGLLVGAAMTQRPGLFRAVLCTYPLLDMLRYHKFLMGPYWVTEYGSADNPDQFDFIYAYSPYQHVKKGVKYPAVMFVTGDSDTRVAPLHARKMTAMMQAATASDRPILLHYDTKAGHSGGSPTSKRIDNITDEQSFIFWQLGIK
jgi:prolyl oligopeptidase